MQYFIERKRLLLGALLATTFFYIAILPLNEGIAFALPYLNSRAAHVALALKIAGFPIFMSLFYFILFFISRLRARDSFYWSWLKISGIYFGIMGVFFLLIYPGHWVGDEFDVLAGVRNYSIYAWQNYITNIFYTYSLYLVPSGVGIVLVQLTLLSFIIGYVVSLSKMLFKKTNIHYLLLIPFLFFPVILNNFYPLRLTLFSYLLLLVFAQLIFLHKKILTPKHPRILLLLVSVVLAVICFWRSEGFIYFLLLPLFAYELGLLRRIVWRKPSSYAMCAIVIGFFGLAFSITKATTSDLYQVTATLNPLSTMVLGNLQGKDTSKDLDAINRVVDLSIVKKYAAYSEIPSFWHGAVRSDYKNHLDGYNSHIYNIFLNNPASFLDNRVRVFLITNSFGGWPSLGLSQFYNLDPSIVKKVQVFYDTNLLSKPINLDTKLTTTKHLLLVNDQYLPGVLAKIAWSIIPTSLILLILVGVGVSKRRLFTSYITALLLIHGLIIFLTAPASYFMYYFPIYLVGNYIIALFTVQYIDRNRAGLSRVKHMLLEKLMRHRPILFLMVGLLNTTLDFLFYTILIHSILPSPDQIFLVGIITGTFALLCAYTTHRLITWRDKHTTRTTILKFFIVTGFGLWVIRPTLLAWFITFTPLYTKLNSWASHHTGITIDNYTVASTCAFLAMALIVMIYNYFMYARFVFIKSQPRHTNIKR